MIAYYDLEIRHQQGHTNPEKLKRSSWLPDVLSRAFKPKIIHNYTPMSETEAEQLISLISLPQDYIITPQMLQRSMTNPGLPSPFKGKPKSRTTKATVTKEDKMPEKNTPRKSTFHILLKLINSIQTRRRIS